MSTTINIKIEVSICYNGNDKLLSAIFGKDGNRFDTIKKLLCDGCNSNVHKIVTVMIDNAIYEFSLSDCVTFMYNKNKCLGDNLSNDCEDFKKIIDYLKTESKFGGYLFTGPAKNDKMFVPFGESLYTAYNSQ